MIIDYTTLTTEQAEELDKHFNLAFHLQETSVPVEAPQTTNLHDEQAARLGVDLERAGKDDVSASA